MLTKDQKMEMVSKAIDAGFTVELNYHESSIEQMDELLEIFRGLPVRLKSPNDSTKKLAWASVNNNSYDSNEDDFEATIYLD